MPTTDLPLDELREYRPPVFEPDDFDEFWAATLLESRKAATGHTLVPVRSPLTEISVFDLTYPGFAGEPVKAWVTRPARVSGDLPVVIEYLGFGGGRGIPGERLQWAASGYVHVLMDTRGQGSRWGSGGETPDPHGSDPSIGFMTRGIRDPATYYYRRVFTDAVRLVDVVRTLDGVDARRIAVTGGSQGGGIAIAVAALAPEVAALMPDVPFLCHFQRAVAETVGEPFSEVAQYLSVHRGAVERVFATLAYFDGVNFARRVTAPAIFSVGLMDAVVLPSTVFAAYNHLAGVDRSIEVYPFNGHEGGTTHQWLRQTEWLAERFDRLSDRMR